MGLRMLPYIKAKGGRINTGTGVDSGGGVASIFSDSEVKVGVINDKDVYTKTLVFKSFSDNQYQLIAIDDTILPSDADVVSIAGSSKALIDNVNNILPLSWYLDSSYSLVCRLLKNDNNYSLSVYHRGCTIKEVTLQVNYTRG